MTSGLTRTERAPQEPGRSRTLRPSFPLASVPAAAERYWVIAKVSREGRGEGQWRIRRKTAGQTGHVPSPTASPPPSYQGMTTLSFQLEPPESSSLTPTVCHVCQQVWFRNRPSPTTSDPTPPAEPPSSLTPWHQPSLVWLLLLYKGGPPAHLAQDCRSVPGATR